MRWAVSFLLAVAAHFGLILLLQPQPAPVLVAGVGIEVQFGVGTEAVTSVPAADAGSEERVDPTQDAPLASQTTDSPVEEAEPAPEPTPPEPPAPIETPEVPEPVAPPEELLEPDPPIDQTPDVTDEPPPLEPDMPDRPEVASTDPPPSPQETSTPNTDGGEGEPASAETASENAGDSEPSDASDTTDESGPPAAPAAQGNSASSNYAGEVRQYLSRLRMPRAESSGSAVVYFVVGMEGELETLSIAESSGSSRFDRQVLRVMERAVPFPVPPADVNRVFTIRIEGR